jgi:D-alanyl-D-alanine carboxypeptidase (penicillin-binding protein 5/6)
MGRLLAVFFLLAAAIFVWTGSFAEGISITSPIPKVFGVSSPQSSNSWFPFKPQVIKKPYDLSLGAKSALIVDYDSGEILYSKDHKLRLPVASTIKIMTALVALENAELDDVFVVSDRASSVGENSMGLVAGERLTLKELLYGLMLVSGNDAAVVIAEGISGSEEEFVGLMNRKAQEIGLLDTVFINASGLDEDGRSQFSTAYDMTVIARYVWAKFPVFGKITSTDHVYFEANQNHKAFDLYNDTNLLTTYPGVRGIKPGFTWEAGLCLVTYAENEGKRIIGVILGSDDRRGEMKELLDFGFAVNGIEISHPSLDL